MAHNIESRDGAHSFAAVGKAWHGLGHQLDGPMTAAEAQRLARMDFQVEKHPSQVINPLTGGMQPSGYYSTIRMDTGRVLGNVGAGYTVLQNKDAFTFFDGLVDEGDAVYESVGVLGNGETIFICAKVPHHVRIDGTDDVTNLYIVLSNTHDGSRAVEAIITPIRVVCNNTLSAARNCNKIKRGIRHTTNVVHRVREAHKLMGMVNELAEAMNDVYNHWAKSPIDDATAKLLFARYLADAKQTERLMDGESFREVFSTRKANNVDKILQFYHEGVGQEKIVGSYWGAFNAITGYETHVKGYRTADNRFKKTILDGNGTDAFRIVEKVLAGN